MNYLYQLLVILSLPAALLRLLWRSRKNPDYRRRLGERFALTAVDSSDAIWLHTVSVGEFLATLPLIERLLSTGEPVLVTTTTPTGSAMVREKLGQRVAHQYLPFDAPFLVKRFLRATQPRVAVFVETEIWANYLQALKQRGIPALLINARLSERSFKGYRKLGGFARRAVGNFTAVACQNVASCQRFLQLGATAHTVGNLKFDLHPPAQFEQQKSQLKTQLGARAFIVVASTHKGEEALILRAYQNSDEQRLLVIAPRHPERSDEVVALAQAQQLSVARYTQLATLTQAIDVLVVDALGQLLPFYALADYAIIGGSFVPHGGHNPLEAALFATPCQIGAHYFNFESLVNEMREQDAIAIIDDKALFTQAPSAAMGDRAKQFLAANQGAVDKYFALIMRFAHAR